MQNEPGPKAGLLLRDRYRLEQPIGRGGMGQVWRGTDLRLRRPVAIKILPSDLAADQNSLARFRREAETAAALQHPGITVVFDIDDGHAEADGTTMFLVMELLEGQDLRAVIRASPGGLPVARTASFATQIADALAAAHARGIVHRDIKPHNLMVLADDRIRICDFGIAHLAGGATRLTAQGSSIGTPAYMAPEQFRGEPLGVQTDLYALGCVIYEMLTGSPPFGVDGDLHALMYRHLNQPAPAPRFKRPETPEYLDRLVSDALAKNPADRPGSAQAVADFLRSRNDAHAPAATPPRLAVPGEAPAFFGEPPAAPEPAHAQAPGTRPRQTAIGRRRRALIAGTAGLAAALIAAGGFLLLRDSGHDRPEAGSSSPSAAKPSGGASSTTQQPAPTDGTVPVGGTDPTGLAAPRQTFRIGQTAKVPFANGGNEKLAITVTSIEKAPASDLAALKAHGKETDGAVLFYARYSAKNLGGGVSDMGGTTPNMEGVLQDGRTILSDLVFGFSQCSGEAPNGELPVGSSYQACALFLAPSGGTVTGVEWVQSGTDKYADPNGVYWKQ
ncbi:serine/threonine-protein kinase [Actinomadura violacea]|uniref:non-specific serine/threonine protein kinase n=1 Tax=Actinomadura violacea TaxID=2819934 RepID=A0ABS3RMV3_9ACTN|nr:serine/threonine-protein kinase [Actinomadura violacea]MBO2458071.1 serine/threonine protein kinase [Actinomadura violacea]